MQQKQNKVKVSIIIPVYNVMEYLEKQIKSCLNQTLKELEVFLVDDGSTDKTSEICDRYSLIDNRIIVIHKKNEGAHKARNVAINKATGKYLAFFDGDDEVDSEMLFDLYNIAEKNSSSMVVSGFYIDTYYDKDKYITLDFIPKKEINYDSKEQFRKDAYLYFDNNMFYSPWNKLYNREYILNNNILFPNTYRDDFPFVISCIRDIEKISFTKKQYYHFKRQRQESETSKYYKNLYEKRVEEHEMMVSLYKYWNLYDDYNAKEMMMRRYVDRIIECITNLQNKNSNLSYNEKIEKIKLYINDEWTMLSLRYAKPKSLYLKIMYCILKIKNIFLINIMTIIIEFVKIHFVKVFSILKNDR